MSSNYHQRSDKFNACVVKINREKLKTGTFNQIKLWQAQQHNNYWTTITISDDQNERNSCF